MKKELYIILAIALLFTGCAQTDDIHIGVLVPLTGEAAIYGEAVRDGILLRHAKSENVHLHFEDSGCRAEMSSRATIKLLGQYDLDAIIGTVCSPGTLSTHQLTEAQKILHVSPTSSAPDITKTHVFRLYPSDVHQAKAAVELMGEKEYETLGILHVETDYGIALKDTVEQNWKGTVHVEQFEQGETTYQTQLLKLESADIDVLYIIGLLQETGNALRQIHELGWEVPLYGTESLRDEELLAIAGEGAEGLTFVVAEQTKHREHDVFVEEFNEYFGREPGLFSDYGYDSLHVVLEAIENTEGSYEAMTSYLFNAEFSGATGLIDFDVNGDVLRGYQTVKVIDGRFTEIPE